MLPPNEKNAIPVRITGRVRSFSAHGPVGRAMPGGVPGQRVGDTPVTMRVHVCAV